MTVGNRFLRRLALLWMGFGLSHCVIRYGEPDVNAPAQAQELPLQPVDFGPVERQLAILVDGSVNVDARDRLEGAWTLAQSMQDADPKAQHIVLAYLKGILEIESRATPEGASLQTRALSSGFAGAETVDSQELAGPEPIQTVERRPEVNLLDPMALEGEPDGEGERVEPPADEGPNVNLLLAEAVRHLEAKEAGQAMAVLEACRDLPCWSDVSDSWAKARDTLVFSEKEALARRFLELRTENDAQVRRNALLEVQQALSVLRATWPDSAHADDVERHMARVQQELESLSELD